MAASWNSSSREQSNLRMFLGVLTSAACEWFLIFMLLLDGVLSYLLTKFAQYCELQTPCLLCSRLDQILGNERPQFYWSLFCCNHRLEISSLISCNMHGKLADGRAICEDCLVSFTCMENYNPETHGPFLGKLGLDCGNFCSHSLLRRDFVPRSFGTGLCSCCKKPLMSRQKARRLLYRSPVGRSVKPAIPLPRMPSHTRSHHRDGSSKMEGRFSEIAYNHFTKTSSRRPSQRGYSKLKITSDSEPEVIYFDKDDHSSTIDGENKSKDAIPIKDSSKTKPKALSVDMASLKLVQQSFLGDSLIDMDFLLEGEPVDVKCMDSDAATGHTVTDLNSRQGNERSKTLLTPKLISLDDAYPTSSTSQDPRNYKSKFPVLRKSKSPSFTDLMSLDVTVPSSGRTSEKLNSPENVDTRPLSTIDQVKASAEHLTVLKVDQAPAISDGSPPTHEESNVVPGSTVKTEEREKPDSVIHGSVPSQATHVDSGGLDGSAVKTNERGHSGSVITDSVPLQLKSEDSSDVNELLVNTEAGEESEPVVEQLQDDINRNSEKDVESKKLDLPSLENSLAQETKQSSSNVNMGVNCKVDEVQMTDTSNSSETSKVKRSLLMDRSESGRESLDMSVISEHEGESIIDRLQRQLEYEQKRMNALYKELEEERSASAVAANQAMAMITRLQEEKASLHMDALQYLRMMEEQAEHDVEALERANDQLTEKEKEIQDLEAELEYYRNNDPNESAMERGIGESYNPNRDNMKGNDTSASLLYNNAKPPDMQTLKEESKGNENLLGKCLWFEDEKLYISECLKNLETQLQKISCDRTPETLPDSEQYEKATYDGVNQGPIDNDDSDLVNHLQEDALCKEESKPTYNGHCISQETSVSSVGGDCLDHKNDSQEARDFRGYSDFHKRVSVSGLENEISDLNDRLESLEAVHDFIEHTLNNLQSGDAGFQLVQEIVQKLRELQNMGIRIRSQFVT